MATKICPECLQTHPSNAAIAVGRFNPLGPVGFTSTHADDAPIRATRSQAETDFCVAQQEIRKFRNYR